MIYGHPEDVLFGARMKFVCVFLWTLYRCHPKDFLKAARMKDVLTVFSGCSIMSMKDVYLSLKKIFKKVAVSC